jgi:hypothetical protein
MRRDTLIAIVVLISVGAASDGFSQVKPTAAQLAACKAPGVDLAIAACEDLVEEFFVNRFGATLQLDQNLKEKDNTGLKPTLSDPQTHLTTFIVGQRKQAFLDVAESALKGDATNDVQAALNQAAQIVSTKAAQGQTGAINSSSGSTSLVTKPTATDLISLAAESGAFTDTVNGNTLTAQANADGLRRYLSGLPFADLKPPTQDILNHVNLSATFTVAQSGSSGVSTSGSATTSTPSVASIILPSSNVSFNSLSANYSFYRPYNPRSAKFITSWKAALGKDSAAITDKVKALESAVIKTSTARELAMADPKVGIARTKWFIEAKTDEDNNDFLQFAKDYAAYCKVYVAALRVADPSNFDANVLAINSALEGLSSVNEQVLDDARGTPLFTLVYTYSTPQNKPATHAATFAAAYVSSKFGTQITANAAGTWFASIPAGATYGRVQSYQFSGELDQPIGPGTAPRAVFSLAGYGQYQYSPTVLNITSGNLAPGTDITLPNNAQVLLGTAGWLGVAQTKLVFNIGKGASIPVAVKWSNKTDLVNGSDWKGQFGFSYDLSAISAMLAGRN